MFRHIPGTRVYLPELPLAWVFVVAGAFLFLLGSICVLRVRLHMWGSTRSWWEFYVNFDRMTVSHLINDYDEPDKWLMALGLFIRIPAVVLAAWGGAGLLWQG